jgi:hypothetical protein
MTKIKVRSASTLPRCGKFAEYFPPNHGGRVFQRVARCHGFAIGLPQDSQVELMFGMARFGEPALSASRSLDFTSRRAEVIHRSASTPGLSASIKGGFSTQRDRAPRRAA